MAAVNKLLYNSRLVVCLLYKQIFFNALFLSSKLNAISILEYHREAQMHVFCAV